MTHAPLPDASDAAALGSEHVAVEEAAYAGGRESLVSRFSKELQRSLTRVGVRAVR